MDYKQSIDNMYKIYRNILVNNNINKIYLYIYYNIFIYIYIKLYNRGQT